MNPKSAEETKLKPVPYVQAVLNFLKTENDELWRWFCKTRAAGDQVEAMRLELLKSAYRLERNAHAHLYELADQVLEKLELQVPVTFYQSQQTTAMNASLAYIPGEVHIILHGPVLSTLTDAELRAMLGHELSHFIFYDGWDGQYRIAREMLTSLTNDPAGESAHTATARLFGLYQEIFCDRGACRVTDDPATVISTLVKLETGLSEVSAASYVRQAEEIFSKGDVKTAGVTHPESFIRARAVRLWADRGEEADGEIERMIQGSVTLEGLDLLGQRKVAALTRRLINQFLSAKWLQSERVLAHARLFFDAYEPPADGAEDAALETDLKTTDKPLRDYYCYVLLDFVAVDRDLEDAPLAWAFLLTGRLGLRDRFSEIVAKELGLRKKQLDKIEREAADIVAKADRRGS